MADPRISHCLSLVREAQQANGPEQAERLNLLLQHLEQLSTSARPGTLGDPALEAHAVLDQLQQPLITLDLAGYLTGWNQAAQALFGYSAAEAVGQHVLSLYADDAGTEVPEMQHSAGQGRMRVRRRKKSGEPFWADMSLSLVRDADNEPVGMVAHLQEVGETVPLDDQLRLHASIIENSDQGILITSGDERIVSVNAAFSRITGYSPEEAIGQTVDLLRSGVHTADFREEVKSALHGAGPWQGEIIGRRKNGELFPQSVSISVVRDSKGEVQHTFSVFSDISVQRASEERMQRLANYDNLTGLPNRSLFNQLLDQALAGARRSGQCGAVMTLDLNRFTAINDTLGSEAGDELLRQVGQRLRQTLRNADLLARVGSDEYLCALLSIEKREHSALVAQKLLDALTQPFELFGNVVHISACVGVAVFPDDGLDSGDLLRSADVAMKRLQVEGQPGYLFYSSEMNQRAKERWQLEIELRQALAGTGLVLHYQPKVSLRNGRIAGAEALIRWQHPVHGMVSPAKFIPVAEETGLILEIGAWVLEEACRQIRAWLDAGVHLPPIAVNLSARQFDRQLPMRMQAVLDRHGVPPELLKLEITESLLVRGVDMVTPTMNELVAMGLCLAMDDFGTGYSSLSYLKRFPITTLKIDRSFVIGVPGDENDCAIAQAIVTMGRQLRQEIVAEGVETMTQMQFLRELGCDQLQGFLFSPAVPAASFETMVREDKRLKLD